MKSVGGSPDIPETSVTTLIEFTELFVTWSVHLSVAASRQIKYENADRREYFVWSGCSSCIGNGP